MRKSVAVALMGAGLLILGAQAEAQTSGEDKGGQPPVQFNFAPPGARSLGMGAAFIGLADDATAAASNPAGLTILTKPEISGHFRNSRFKNEFPNTVTQVGVGSFEKTVSSPSFFSVVVPKGSVAVSAYYQRSVDYANASSFSGRFPDLPNLLDTDAVSTDFLVENLGLSLALKLGSKASVGGSVRRTNTKVVFNQSIRFTAPNVPGASDTFTATMSDSANKVTFNAGVLVNPTSKVSLGAVYKKGATFNFTQAFSEVFVFPGAPTDTNSSTRSTEFTIPDAFGGGIAIRPSDHFTVLADVVHITYSDISAEGTLFAESSQSGAEKIKDGTEIHGGLEYTFSAGKSSLVALRAGAYTDPDHDGLKDVDSKQVHGTFGGGVVFNNKIQVDAAFNIAKTVREGLLSMVVRF